MTDMLISPAKPHTGEANKRHVLLLGIGTAVPLPVSQEEAVTFAQEVGCESDGQRAWLKRVFMRSGVESRGSVLQESVCGGMTGIRAFYGRPQVESEGAPEILGKGPTTAARMERYIHEAPLLMEQAAKSALQRAGIAAGQITHIITVSCTGFFAPGLDVEMISRLGLRPTVRRTHVGFMGCHAAFNALAAARDAARADPDAIVLVCCVELSTLHFAYGWAPEKMVANALFADGAGACVVGSAAPGRQRGKAGGWRLMETASLLLPDSRDAMTWRIGDHGFEMTLSAELPSLIGRHVRGWCERWLAESGVDLAEIELWAIHPGGPKILAAAEEALGLDEDATKVSRAVLAEHGNMSSATLWFLLDRLEQGAAERDGKLCVAIGFGPGLMAEGLLLEAVA